MLIFTSANFQIAYCKSYKERIFKMNKNAPKRKSRNRKKSYLLPVLLLLCLIVLTAALISVLSNKPAKQNSTPPTVPDTGNVSDATADTTTEPTIPQVSFFGKEYAQDITELTLPESDIAALEHETVYSCICDALNSFTELELMDVRAAALTLDEMTSLKENYPSVRFIWNVDLYGTELSSDDKEADISGIVITDIEALKTRLRLLYSLTYLDMCDCGLTNEQMEELQNEFPQIKFVWKVTLGLWTIRTDTVAFSTLKDGTITYRLTNDDCKVLKYCTDMVALDLGHNKVTDLSFLEFMPELKILILVDNWLTDTQSPYLYDLSMLKYCPKLMYLEFFVGDVTDISVFDYLPNLVDLNISYNPISDVSHLLNFTKLERLYIEHTSLTEQDYELLKETYPDAYIVYYGEGSVDQGWREHERYFAMIDMFHNNYVNDLFKD